MNNCAPGTCTIADDMFVAGSAWHHLWLLAATHQEAMALNIDGEKRGNGRAFFEQLPRLVHWLSVRNDGASLRRIRAANLVLSRTTQEPAMWNVALPDTQIADVFNVGIDLLSTELVAIRPRRGNRTGRGGSLASGE